MYPRQLLMRPRAILLHSIHRLNLPAIGTRAILNFAKETQLPTDINSYHDPMLNPFDGTVKVKLPRNCSDYPLTVSEEYAILPLESKRGGKEMAVYQSLCQCIGSDPEPSQAEFRRKRDFQIAHCRWAENWYMDRLQHEARTGHTV